MRKKILTVMLLLLLSSLLKAQEKVNTGPLPYAEGSTGNFEVVITYNNIEQNKEAKLTLYISDFKTNVPVENAKLEIDIPGIDNTKINILPSADPGIYEVQVVFPEIKKYTFLINITSSEKTDLVAINDMDIGKIEEVKVKDKEPKSFITIIHENLLLIIISTFITILIAFVFYRIGRNKNSVPNLDNDFKNNTKELKT